MLTKKFDVSGMCCATCITKINGALDKIMQIKSYNVQMTAPQVTLVLEKDVPHQEIIDIINSSGHYSAEVAG